MAARVEGGGKDWLSHRPALHHFCSSAHLLLCLSTCLYDLDMQQLWQLKHNQFERQTDGQTEMVRFKVLFVAIAVLYKQIES